MASKGVLDRQRIAKEIVATGRTHADEVGDSLRQILSRSLPGDREVPDMVELQRLMADHLEARTRASIAADEAHLREQRDDDEPRRRRDAAAGELYSTLVGIRETLASGFGPDHLEALLGYDGETPTDPLKLHRLASRALELLREPEVTIPPLRLRGVTIELAELADELQPALDGLSQALVHVDTERRETETTLLRKDRALDDLDAAISGVGRILIGCNELAGFPAYGDRIRLSLPARRRRGSVPGGSTTSAEPPQPTETSEAERSGADAASSQDTPSPDG